MTQQEHEAKVSYFIAMAMMMLDDYDELEELPIHRHEVKRYGNLFIKALEKSMKPFESHSRSVDFLGEIHTTQEIVGYVIKQISSINPLDMVKISNIIANLDAYEDPLKDEESINS